MYRGEIEMRDEAGRFSVHHRATAAICAAACPCCCAEKKRRRPIMDPERILAAYREALSEDGSSYQIPEMWDGRSATGIVKILARIAKENRVVVCGVR